MRIISLLNTNFNLTFYVKDLKSHIVAQVVYALFTHKGEKRKTLCQATNKWLYCIYFYFYINIFLWVFGELVPIDLLETFQWFLLLTTPTYVDSTCRSQWKNRLWYTIYQNLKDIVWNVPNFLTSSHRFTPQFQVH